MKLEEIGDSFSTPLKRASYEKDQVLYNFNLIPEQGPYAGEQLTYEVSFVLNAIPPETFIQQYKTAEDILPEEKEFLQLLSELPKPIRLYRSLFIWTITFQANNQGFDLMDLQDRKASITVVNNVRIAVESFLNPKNKKLKIDGVEFSADLEEHGRVVLYERFTQQLASKLGWLHFESVQRRSVRQRYNRKLFSIINPSSLESL